MSRELFGRSLPVFDFPRRQSVMGLGLSDLDALADHLTKKFSYRNTYYDRAPRFDIRFDDSPIGDLDFLISSEVFEHVEPPAGQAFRNSARLLKPSGFLLLTVPWVYDGIPENALPDLYDWKLAQEDGRWVIVNRSPAGNVQRYDDLVFDGRPGPCLGSTREHFPNLLDWRLLEANGAQILENHPLNGGVERFENLTFHGGSGLVLEMRLFTRGGLQRELSSAGFRSIEFEEEECPAFGIVFPYTWSRPIIARL
ncbi:MAG: class I SAM-dependent methyltransferase [Acidobacteriia bacterium]|nr:class I SAM-dependent methyltransferase [Terriglobia bacterium]